MVDIQKKYWCFTLNNYTEADELFFKDKVPSVFKYVRYGKEVAPTTGTCHMQGWFILKDKKRFNVVKNLLTDGLSQAPHIEACKGNEADNERYCSKSGDVVVLGAKETKQGSRSELDAFKATVLAGCYDMKRLREEHSDVCAKYPRFVADFVQDQVPMPEIEVYPLRLWQQDLNLYLNAPPNPRQILFVVDPIGNTGKTWFAKYYCRLHPENTQYMEAGKKTDMAYALNPNIRVLFVNCTRKMCDFLPYGFLESVKDGIVFSSKYESRNKILGPVHVVILMNEQPDENALSHDRYKYMYPEDYPEK